MYITDRQNSVQRTDGSLQYFVMMCGASVHFSIISSVRSIAASEKVLLSADFPGEIRVLVRAESEGRGECKWSEERKEEDAGESGVDIKFQKKIPMSSSQAFFVFFLLGNFFLSCRFSYIFFPNITSMWKVSYNRCFGIRQDVTVSTCQVFSHQVFHLSCIMEVSAIWRGQSSTPLSSHHPFSCHVEWLCFDCSSICGS